VAAVWIVADAGVARAPLGGLSWGELGYAFHDLAPGRAVASVGGVALVTYCTVVLNAALAQLLVRRRILRSYVAIVAIAAVVVGATVTRADPHVTKALHVALLQGNDKNRDLTNEELDARYLPNSHFDLATRVTDPVDLIVFPESSMDENPATDPYLQPRLSEIARRHRAWVLANATTDAPPDGAKALNLDVLFAPNGEVVGQYAKRHLVPYGEYVPLRSVLQPVIGELSKVPRDFRRGSGPGLFDVAGARIATVICFESVFGYQIRPLVRDGAQVIVVSTNNRSYRRSANSAQHLAIGQMRAAETGRPVVQAAISGITGVIDADGVVHDETKLFERTVVETTVGATTGQTPYVRFGEWATLTAIVLVLGAVALALVRRRRKPSLDSAPHEVVDIEARLGSYGNAPEEVESGRA
jgi:apolipoprotein N-acyltransferase